MSEANKTLVQRFFTEVWNGGSLMALDEIIAADHIPHDPQVTDIGPGPAGQRTLVTRYRTAFPDTHFTIDDILAEGDKVVARWTATGTQTGQLMDIAPTGKRVTATGVTVCRCAGGKIAESWNNWDTLGMMQQLGVIPAASAAGT